MDSKTSVKSLIVILQAMQEQAQKAFEAGDYEVAATLWEDLGALGWVIHHRTYKEPETPPVDLPLWAEDR